MRCTSLPATSSSCSPIPTLLSILPGAASAVLAPRPGGALPFSFFHLFICCFANVFTPWETNKLIIRRLINIYPSIDCPGERADRMDGAHERSRDVRKVGSVAASHVR